MTVQFGVLVFRISKRYSSLPYPHHMLPHDLQGIPRAIVGSHCVGAVPEVEMAPNRLSTHRA